VAKRARGLFPGLLRRESTARLPVSLRERPLGKRRLVLQLDDLVGIGHPAARSVILGFTADGEHLLSYTFAQDEDGGGGYMLQLWRMPAGTGTLTLAFATPVFQCGSSALDFGDSAPPARANITPSAHTAPCMLPLVRQSMASELLREIAVVPAGARPPYAGRSKVQRSASMRSLRASCVQRARRRPSSSSRAAAPPTSWTRSGTRRRARACPAPARAPC
jgi:hypothetical protein